MKVRILKEHIYIQQKDVESTYYIATAVSNTTITVNAVTYTRDVYEYLEPINSNTCL